MKRIALVALATTLLVAAAHAEGKGGLGFRLSGTDLGAASASPVNFTASPNLGIRQWLSERAGLDAALGFATISAENATTKLADGTGFSFDLGVPISAKKWEKVNLIFRPGFIWSRVSVEDKTSPVPPNKTTGTLMAFTGEIEVEWMVADMLSISASHGIAYHSTKIEDNDTPKSELKTSGFQSVGSNFTSLGFHVYLW